MEGIRDDMRDYFTHVSMAEALGMAELLFSELENDMIPEGLRMLRDVALQSAPEIPEACDFNAFGGPSMLPTGWRDEAQGPGKQHEASGQNDQVRKVAARMKKHLADFGILKFKTNE